MIHRRGSSFHKVWRGQNKDWNIGDDRKKVKYLDSLQEEKAKDPNPIHAFCLRSKYTHEVYSLKELCSYSNFMRRHHGQHGMYFNLKHKRCGKVAQARPLTSQFENEEHEMRASLYIHSNPLRAGICHDVKDYEWSTHNLYAYGKKTKWLKDQVIVFPLWYMDFGNNNER